jgi:thiol:disulfide interchange protein DsbD
MATGLFAQDPAHVSYSVKKLDSKKFEVSITVTLEEGWHIYSQVQPKEAIADPTEIRFNKNPLLVMEGKPKEIGKKEKYEDKSIGAVQYQFGDKVDFVQTVALKNNVKTNVTGSITYEICNNVRCMPSKTVNFSVALQ